MDADSLLLFVRFHAWSNRQIMDTAAKLTDAELRDPGPFDHGTAFQTLRHLVDVDWSWRAFCQGNDPGQTYVWDTVPMEDLASIAAFSASEDATLTGYVGDLDETGVTEMIGLNPEDPADAVPRWLIVAHVVNHGTQHRSELARYFTQCGHSPGEFDLIDAMRL